MSPRLRSLGGQDVIRILTGFGFQVIGIRGSHSKLRRILPSGDRQILTIPLHRSLAPGTLHAIYRQALRFVPEAELKPKFYAADERPR
jgi:predicted RNA binding protein YcfA (HicA-like mRNA interferase family)